MRCFLSFVHILDDLLTRLHTNPDLTNRLRNGRKPLFLHVRPDIAHRSYVNLSSDLKHTPRSYLYSIPSLLLNRLVLNLKNFGHPQDPDDLNSDVQLSDITFASNRIRHATLDDIEGSLGSLGRGVQDDIATPTIGVSEDVLLNEGEVSDADKMDAHQPMHRSLHEEMEARLRQDILVVRLKTDLLEAPPWISHASNVARSERE